MATVMMGIWWILVLAGFIALTALALSVWKFAYYSYNEIGSALKFAVYAADYNGTLMGQGQITAQEVEPYFKYAFSKETNTVNVGDEFVGGPYANPVVLEGNGLIPVQPGDVIKPGVRALEPGFEVMMRVPIFSGGVFGLPPLNVTMYQFAVSESVPAASQ